VELWLSGAGEIGISFLGRACCVRAVAEVVGDCLLRINGLLLRTWDAIVEV